MKAIDADFFWVLPPMSTIDLHTARLRRRKGRIRPTFDRLESRLALSGAGAGLSTDLTSGPVSPGIQDASVAVASSPIVASDPAPASVVESSPSALTVTFSGPIDPFSIRNNDFELVHVAPDGSTTPLPESEAGLSETVDPADPSGARIVLTLSQPLADGRYRLLLRADNQLQSTDGSAVSAGGSDLEVSAFTVGTPGHGLAQAVDVGVAGSVVAVKTDVLDLSGNPGEFKLYKLTLPAGHHWRLGVSVSALPSASPLLSVVSLFDAQGHLVATASRGRSNSIRDPFLFEGVAPGTYFVGVSGRGDVPGQAGGYDPAQGIAGTSGTAQAGGPFQLAYVADPADKPTTVLGLRLDRADPYSTTPTGLTVQFSGPIQVADLLKSGQTSLTLVDDSGQSWAVKPLHYDETQAQLSILFDQTLPPGRYTLEVPAGSALVDLAGLVPGALGRPSGVLGTFKVSTGKAAAGDLGAILPGTGGVSAPVQVAAGGSIVEHFTVIEPGIYTIDGGDGSAGLSFSLSRADGSVVGLPTAHGGTSRVDGFLFAGTYSLTVANAGSQAFLGTVAVVEKQSFLDSLLLGGVAQGPALSLRLIAPTLSIDSGGTDPAPSGPNASTSGVNSQAAPGGSAGSGQAGPSSSAPSPVSGAVPAVPSGAIPLFTSGLVGRPSSTGEPISVVGPSGPSGSVALASSSEGLPRGIVGIPTRTSRGNAGGSGRHLEDRPSEVPTAPGAAGAEIDFGLISQNRDRGVDDKVLSEAGWIDRIAALSLERLEFLSSRKAPPAPAVEVASVELPGGLAAEAVPGDLDSPRVEVASIAPSVGLGVLAMIAYRNRDRILVTLAQGRKAEPKSNHRTLYSGPHRRILRVLR